MRDFARRVYADFGRDPPADVIAEPTEDIYNTLDTHITAWPYLLDMHQLVVVNQTPLPLITSDAPVAFHNDAFLDLKKGGATAYASPGLIVFVPISRTIGYMLFDRNLYATGYGRLLTRVLANESDVGSLNRLVAASAVASLYYFPSQGAHAAIKVAVESAKAVRPKAAFVGHEYSLREKGGSRRLLGVSPTCAQFSLSLSFLKQLPKRVNRMRLYWKGEHFPGIRSSRAFLNCTTRERTSRLPKIATSASG